MFRDNNQSEMFYHAALVHAKKFSAGTKSGDLKLRRLLEEHGSFREIYLSIYGEMFPDMRNDPELDRIASRIRRINFEFRVLTVNDVQYPSHLRKLPDATPVLYTRGDIGLLEHTSIAVVGTRRLDDLVDMAEGTAIVQRLVSAEHVIVSGLALGCDTLAHTKAIEYGGKTIAVLGTPITKHYPKENRELQDKIASEHLVLTQYPVGISTYPPHFAHRNLTTVGLSTEGVVVVRSDDKSGTLHAVRNCVEQGKQLYVLANNLGREYKWVLEYRNRMKIPNARK